MFENLKTRFVIIFAVIGFATYFILPTLKLYNSNYTNQLERQNLEKQSIGLGLDLKGGLRITLELDEPIFLRRLVKKNLSSQSKTELDVLLNEAIFNSNNNNTEVIKELINTVNEKSINLNKFYSNLSTSSDNNEIISKIKEQKNYAMESILEIMRNRITEHDQYGVGEPSIQRIGNNRLVVELAGITDLQKAKEYIQRTADFELTLVRSQSLLVDSMTKISDYVRNNKEYEIPLDSLVFPDPTSEGYIVEEKNYKKLNAFLNNSQIKQLITNNSKIIWENNTINFSLRKENNEIQEFRRFYLVASKPAISSGMIQNPKALIADIGNDIAGQWVVNLDMTKEGRKKWSIFTSRNINKQVAIVLDNKMFMAPFIRDKISTGSTQISGFASMEEAKDIAAVLKAGELPAPIKAVQTNFVGPSLGKDSIESGKNAMSFGIILVFIFMILYYKGSGLVANVALLMNLIIVLAVLITMNAVLTLPGIAGLLLTVGMTVDANVIIFERIKEEISVGRSHRSSLIRAYDKAFLTILDANITTLLTAFVLSFIGSGPIKGFATTLSVGIICSMFTAIFVTRSIFLFYLNKKQRLSI